MITQDQELQWQRQIAAIKRAKKGIGVAKDIGQSSHAQDGGDPNEDNSPQNETLPEEEQPSAAGELRKTIEEEAKRRIKERVAAEAKKRIAMVLLKNPYVLATIGIILGVIFLITVIVVAVEGDQNVAQDAGITTQTNTATQTPASQTTQ
jgi:hypothetical protein